MYIFLLEHQNPRVDVFMIKQKKEKIKIRFKEVALPPEELQRRVDRAFDILFDSIFSEKKEG